MRKHYSVSFGVDSEQERAIFAAGYTTEKEVANDLKIFARTVIEHSHRNMSAIMFDELPDHMPNYERFFTYLCILGASTLFSEIVEEGRRGEKND